MEDADKEPLTSSVLSVRSGNGSGVTSSSTENSVEENSEALNDDQLLELINKLEAGNKILLQETDLLALFLKKLDAREMTLSSLGISTSVEALPISTSSPALETSESITYPSFLKSYSASSSMSYNSRKQQKIQFNHKLDICKKIIVDIQKRREKTRSNFHQKSNENEGILQEQQLHKSEIDATIQEFQKEMRRTEDPLKRKEVADKIISHTARKLKLRDDQMRNIFMGNSAKLSQLRKLRFQIRQREEMADKLQPVDFEQLSTENRKLMDELDSYSKRLQHLKRFSANLAHALSDHKKHLRVLQDERNNLIRSMALKKKQIESVYFEKEDAVKHNEKFDNRLAKLENYLGKFRIPALNDYFDLKVIYNDLVKQKADYERKIEAVRVSVITAKREQHRREKSAPARSEMTSGYGSLKSGKLVPIIRKAQTAGPPFKANKIKNV